MAGFTNNLSLRKKPQTQREKRNEVRDQAKQAATKAKTSNKRPRTITASPVLDYGTPSSNTGNTAQSESSSRKYSNVRKPSFSAAYVKSEQESKKANTSSRKPYYNSEGRHAPQATYVYSGDSATKPAKTATSKTNSRPQKAIKSGDDSSPTTKPNGTNTSQSGDKTMQYVRAFGKGNWNAEQAMKWRREDAKAQGKGNWNAEEEMRKRREAAKANGKGNWNAEEEMRKRREAAAAKKKGGRA